MLCPVEVASRAVTSIVCPVRRCRRALLPPCPHPSPQGFPALVLPRSPCRPRSTSPGALLAQLPSTPVSARELPRPGASRVSWPPPRFLGLSVSEPGHAAAHLPHCTSATLHTHRNAQPPQCTAPQCTATTTHPQPAAPPACCTPAPLCNRAVAPLARPPPCTPSTLHPSPRCTLLSPCSAPPRPADVRSLRAGACSFFRGTQAGCDCP